MTDSRPISLFRGKERVKGIEPSCPAWEAGVLPLNYTRENEEVKVTGERGIVKDQLRRKAAGGFIGPSRKHSQHSTSGAIVPGADSSRSRRYLEDRSLRRSGVIPVARLVCERNHAAAGRQQTSVPLRFARPDWRVGRAIFCNHSRLRARR